MNELIVCWNMADCFAPLRYARNDEVALGYKSRICYLFHVS
jgi:hypothetical protein